MNTKHTPGPWVADVAECANIRDCDGYLLAQATHLQKGGRRDSDVVSANARLIAAAPDLLEALQFAMLERACNAGDSILSGDEWREFSIKARAAIAKATEP